MRVAFGLFLGACLVSLALSDVAADLHFGFGKAQERSEEHRLNSVTVIT